MERHKILAKNLKLKDLRNYPENIALRWLLVIPLVLQTVGATALVGYLSYQSGQQIVESLAYQLLQQTSERVRDRLDSLLQTPQQIVAANSLEAKQGTLNVNQPEQLQQQLWQQMRFNSSLPANGFWHEKGSGISYRRVITQEESALTGQLTGQTLPIGTLYISKNSLQQRQFYLVDSQGKPRKRLFQFKPDPPQSAWYFQAKAKPQQHWTDVQINPVASILQVTAIAPVYDTVGKFQGLFTSNYLLVELSAFLNTLNFSPKGKIFIIEPSGDLVATSVSSEAMAMRQVNGQPTRLAAIDSQDELTRAVAQHLRQKFGGPHRLQAAQQFHVSAAPEPAFVQVTPYRDRYGLNWLMVLVMPDSDFMAQIHAQNQRTILLGLATLGVTITLGFLIAQRITKPLHRLNRSARHIAQNQFDQGVPVTGVGEVRQLSQAFQQMAEQLQLSFQLRTGYQRELEQQVAERTAELAHSRDLREAIFNESTDAIFLVEPPPTTRILDCNQRALELFEVASKAELVGIQGASLQKHPYTEDEIAEVAAEIEQKGFWSGEIEYVTKTGKCFWGNLAAKPITVAGQAMQLVRLTDISDRKQLELALQQSEVKTKNILDSTIAGIASMRVFEDGTWVIEQVSEGAESICGYSTEALTQDNQLWISLILAEDWEVIAPQIFTNIFAGATFAYEYRLLHKDGRLRWISQTNNSFWNEEQRYWNVTAISVDITDRKQTELELQAKTEELDRFFSVALDLLCIADLDGYFRRLNQEWEKTLGYSLQELEGRRFLDFVHPDDIASTLDEMSLLANQKASLNFANRYRCRDGSYRWIEWRSCLVDKLVYAAARDITDRRKAELALRQSEQKFKGAFDTISVGMALVSPAGGFIEVNAALCRMLDYTEDELLKLRLEDIEHPGDRGVDTSWLEPILSGAQPSHQAERRFLSKQGKTIWGLMNLAVMHNTQAAPLYLIVQIADLSDRHRLDTMKDEFISIVSHELRTPLTAIRGSLGILKAGVLSDEPETAQQMLDVALRSTDRLVRLVNDILNLERLESGKAILKKEPCEMSDLIAQAVESVQAIADQAKISIEWTSIAASVDVAPDAIVQTLTNLLSNAIKFSPMGCSISLKAEVRDAISLPVSKQLLQGQAPSYTTCVLVSIADQGRGIPPEKLESIFGRFQQVDSSDSRQKGGTGLGLAICRSIVQQHEGQIWVESILGKGSTFYFMLPIQENEGNNFDNSLNGR